MKLENKKLYLLDIFIIAPYILISMSPILMFGVIHKTNAEVNMFWNEKMIVDYFSYYKAALVVMATFLSVLIVFSLVVKDKTKLKPNAMYTSLLIFGVLMIISHAFSKYPYTSFYGLPERYEGILVNISYIMIFITMPIIVTKREQINIIILIIIITSSIVGVIGVFQFLGYDILKLDIVTNFLNDNIVNSLGFTDKVLYISEYSNNRIYSTLYNPNTLGHYMSMILPLALFMIPNLKSDIRRIYILIVSVLLFVNLIGSQSRGSIISFFIVTVLYGYFISRRINLRWKHILVTILSGLILIALINYSSNSNILSRLSSIRNLGVEHEEDYYIDKIKRFEIDNNKIVVETSNQLLVIDLSKELPLLRDRYNNTIDYNILGESGHLILKDKDYKDFEIQYVNEFIKIKKGKSYLLFTKFNDRILFLDPYGKVMSEYDVNHKEYGIERIGSGRGYIWLRSIALIKENVLYGVGADSFIFNFPQNDYPGKLKYLYDAYIIIDKPHNMYIQIAVNFGLVGLLSFLIFIVGWLKKMIVNVKADKNNTLIAILPAVLSFLLSSIFTDSTVSVTPTFWLLLGLGYTNVKIVGQPTEIRK